MTQPDNNDEGVVYGNGIPGELAQIVHEHFQLLPSGGYHFE